MTTKHLAEAKNCAACHEPMKAGDAFRWFGKRVYKSSKVGAEPAIVYVPAHQDEACVLRKFETFGVEAHNRAISATIAMMEGKGFPEEVMQGLRDQLK